MGKSEANYHKGNKETTMSKNFTLVGIGFVGDIVCS